MLGRDENVCFAQKMGQFCREFFLLGCALLAYAVG